MARPSEILTNGLGRVVYLESEEDEVEFLYCPELKWMYPQPIPLAEGDQFLNWWMRSDVSYAPDAFFRAHATGDTRVIDELYSMWRRTKGEIPVEELQDAVNELQRETKQLLKALKHTLTVEGEDMELEAELAELRVEKAIA